MCVGAMGCSWDMCVILVENASIQVTVRICAWYTVQCFCVKAIDFISLLLV